MNSSWPNLLALQRLDISQAALVAWRAAEAGGEKLLDQFAGQRRPDHFPAQTKDVHVLIFDAMMGTLPVASVATTVPTLMPDRMHSAPPQTKSRMLP